MKKRKETLLGLGAVAVLLLGGLLSTQLTANASCRINDDDYNYACLGSTGTCSFILNSGTVVYCSGSQSIVDPILPPLDPIIP